MGRSMYSLILLDDVVRAVDKQAYERGTSRSNLINQILAGYLSIRTPEMHIEDIFRRVVGVAEETNSLQIPAQASNSILQVKSVLNYKYNPTIRYSIEILSGDGRFAASFKVISRSQSRALLEMLEGFFRIWDDVEASSRGAGTPRAEIADGRYRRELQADKEDEILDAQQLGDAIGDFIRVFDKSLDLYFDLEGAQSARGGINQLYRDYLGTCGLIL